MSEWLKTVENSKNSVSARVFFPQIVENEVESLDFRQKTGKTDRNFMKNVEKSSHFSTKGGEIVGETILNLQNTFLSACGNVCFFQYESKRLCYTNDSKKHSY